MPYDPRFDPRLNPWPLPPGWLTPANRPQPSPQLWFTVPPATRFMKPAVPSWGSSGWGYGQGAVLPWNYAHGEFGLVNPTLPAGAVPRPRPVGYVPRSRVPRRA